MKIENCTSKDIDKIFWLYEQGSNYQRSQKGVVVWPRFKRELIETEIAEGRQWKLVINDSIMGVWAISFSDEQIWEAKNKDRAVYIHRIAVNPDFRGNDLVKKIVHWAKGYAKSNNKQYIRLDTMGKNIKLIEYYQKAGFSFLGMFELKNTDTLPDHYHNNPACLFEIEVT